MIHIRLRSIILLTLEYGSYFLLVLLLRENVLICFLFQLLPIIQFSRCYPAVFLSHPCPSLDFYVLTLNLTYKVVCYTEEFDKSV